MLLEQKKHSYNIRKYNFVVDKVKLYARISISNRASVASEKNFERVRGNHIAQWK